MSETNPTKVQIYDPRTKNRLEFNNGDIVHIYGELTDERYVQWLKDMKVQGSEDSIDEESREASCKLWDDTIETLENVEFGGDAKEWRQYVPFSEKIESINNFLAVGIFEPETKPTGPRRLGPEDDITVITEAWFNGEAVKQTHTLRAKTFELDKKYARIQQARFKQERSTGSFRKQKNHVTFIPQDERIGYLYDEMFINVEGFAVDFANKPNVPLRFKTAVIHEIFSSNLDPKK